MNQFPFCDTFHFAFDLVSNVDIFVWSNELKHGMNNVTLCDIGLCYPTWVLMPTENGHAHSDVQLPVPGNSAGRPILFE